VTTQTLDQAARRLRDLGNGGARKVIARAVRTSALEAERIAKAETYPASGLQVRSGRLRASIGGSSREGSTGVELVLGAGGSRAGKDVRYASVHEGLNPDGSRRTATIIKPVNGRYLRIPTIHALTAAGVDRYPGRLRETAAGVFRFVPTDRGGVLVPNKAGKGGAQQPPWYNLVRQVRVPARPFLRPALLKVRPFVATAIEKGLEQAVHGGGNA
jgi:hypothetical protein